MRIQSYVPHIRNQTIWRVIAWLTLCSAVPAKAIPVVWINEIHYDNNGSDVNEFVEVAGVAGTVLTGYQIVFYNGLNGTVYSTVNLSGVLANQQNGFGALAFFSAGIQNGAPDGIELISPTSEIQFLSYEGVFTATAGPGSGLQSTDIGVSELGTEPSGLSLQLKGIGSDYADFDWSAPSAATPGILNRDQFFEVASPPAQVPEQGATGPLLAFGVIGILGFAVRSKPRTSKRCFLSQLGI